MNALTSLKEDIAKPSVKIVVGDLANRISEGASLRDACSEHPRSFSRIYCALVEVGESTGKLDEILVALADLLEWEEDIKRKMIEASTYPIILLTVMLGVVSLLVIKVIPTFEPIFYTLGVELPLPTRIILFVSKYARILWMPVFLGAILAVIGIKFYGSSEKGRYNLDHIKLKLPIFGDLVEKSSFSRFSHVFSLCMNSGVSVLESLELSAEATGNTYITKGVATASDFVSKGEKIADSFKTLGMFPLLVVRMINVGEVTGKLGETKKKVAEFYDKIVPATIRKMFAIFEPAMIVFMGVIVGGIALSLFLPLFQLAGQLGQ